MRDIDGQSDIATVTVTVDPVNDSPEANDDSTAPCPGTDIPGDYCVDEDTVLAMPAPGVLANDTDIDVPPDTLTAVLDTDVTNGTLFLYADGSFDYQPLLDYVGPDSFTYRVWDGTTFSSPATVDITVVSTNDVPSAAPDFVTTDEDTAAAIDVLANDSGLGDVPLTLFVEFPGPPNGDATVNPNGTPGDGSDDFIDYTPDPDYNGPDTFRYRVVDNDLELSEALVQVTVNSINDAPNPVADFYTVNEDPPSPLSEPAPGVLWNDSDVEAPPQVLTADLVSTTINGTLVFNANGSFVYTPDPDFNGIDTFRYRVFDGIAYSGSTIVTINVISTDDMPNSNDDTTSTDEDVWIDIDVLANDILGNDPLVGDQPVTLTVETQPGNGSASVVGGLIRYIPDPDFNGSDAFDYRVTDADGDPDIATVYLTVNSVDDLPDAVDDVATTNEDVAVMIPVLTNDTGLGDTPIIVEVYPDCLPCAQPTNGTITVVGNQIRYTPNLNFGGSDTFSYRVTDGDLPVGDFDTATVSVTVTPVNDDPVAVDDPGLGDPPILTNEDTPIAIDVLDNDFDIDLPPQTLLVVGKTDGANGSVTITGGGTGVEYSPNADWFGPDSFSYTISDGAGGTDTAAVSVTVNSVNDVPVANNDLASTPEDTPVTIAVLANDRELGDAPVVVTFDTLPTSGLASVNGDNTITYTPPPDWPGPADSFTYQVTDANGDSDVAAVDISVTPVNDPPVAGDDNDRTFEDTTVTVDVLANDTDIDLPLGPDVLSVIGVSDPPNGTAVIISGGLAVRYTPDPDPNGSDGFTYTLSDGVGGTDVGSVSVSVTAVNDAPVAVDDAYSTNEDTTLVFSAPGVLANDTDIDSPGLTATLVTDVSNGILTLNTDGSFTYAPDPDWFGSDSFTYQASDGSLPSNTATVTITVNPVPPEIGVGKFSAQPSVLVGDTIIFRLAWWNLGPGTATGVVLGDSITGPCTLIPPPSFPYVVPPSGSVMEGDGGFIDVYARADAVGTCTNTATLQSDRWDPPPSSFSVDINAPLGPSSVGPSMITESPEALPTPIEEPLPTAAEDTATPGPVATEAPTPSDPPTPAEPPVATPTPEPATPTTEATTTGMAVGAPLLLIVLAPTIFKLRRSRGCRDQGPSARSAGPGGRTA